MNRKKGGLGQKDNERKKWKKKRSKNGMGEKEFEEKGFTWVCRKEVKTNRVMGEKCFLKKNILDLVQFMTGTGELDV